MTTPQNTPVGKHAAQAPQTSQGPRPPGQRRRPLVRLVNASKRYGAVIALSDITLEVGAGEVTCVLGDNGAGKSTLIKIIAGLHQPSSGTYEVEGTGWPSTPRVRRSSTASPPSTRTWPWSR